MAKNYVKQLGNGADAVRAELPNVPVEYIHASVITKKGLFTGSNLTICDEGFMLENVVKAGASYGGFRRAPVQIHDKVVIPAEEMIRAYLQKSN